jgi:hypothetical protein
MTTCRLGEPLSAGDIEYLAVFDTALDARHVEEATQNFRTRRSVDFPSLRSHAYLGPCAHPAYAPRLTAGAAPAKSIGFVSAFDADTLSPVRAARPSRRWW